MSALVHQDRVEVSINPIPTPAQNAPTTHENSFPGRRRETEFTDPPNILCRRGPNSDIENMKMDGR